MENRGDDPSRPNLDRRKRRLIYNLIAVGLVILFVADIFSILPLAMYCATWPRQDWYCTGEIGLKAALALVPILLILIAFFLNRADKESRQD